MAPEASPVASSTLSAPNDGNPSAACWQVAHAFDQSSAASREATSPRSNVLAKDTTGVCDMRSMCLSPRVTTPSRRPSASIRLTPPTVLRNWLGGFTWNGRTASTNT